MHQYFLLLMFLCLGAKQVHCATFTVVNRCDQTIWPAILSNAGSDPMGSTGFVLATGNAQTLRVPADWAGRLWARTGCTFDGSGHGTCRTGDCGSYQIGCNGAGATPPATLVEFKLNGAEGKDFYDVSLVDGYNMPVLVEAKGGAGSCTTTGCVADLIRQCPNELKSTYGDGCRSACEAFGKPEYCCIGEFANPNTCKPSVYSEMFKSACPRSYSYAYDDSTSTFTCTGADYVVTFCPESVPSRTTSKVPSPHGVFLQDDSWIASLAMGGARSVRIEWKYHFLQQAPLVIFTISFCTILPYL